jgi:hypothetical protein
MSLNYADVRLNYDPSAPQQRFRNAGLEAAFLSPSAQLPKAPQWPADGAPKPVILSPVPAPTDSLSRFHGYDAVIVTWTAAEAAAMAALLTPDHPVSEWYLYRHGVADYLPLVTGARAPFNDSSPEMDRYFHTLGLYFPCKIGDAHVLLFKSGLHFAYDGPHTPVKKLMAELVSTIEPSVFITTGTGGGIGADVKLGDVIVGNTVRFDCTGQFKNEPWKDAAFKASELPARTLPTITPALLSLNAARIPNARSVPKIWSAANDTIVTTDIFAFDDSTDYYKLQGLGQVCEMGDAMVAKAIEGTRNLSWFAIRNASDPQMANPENNVEQAEKEAAQIYAKYGGLTTAASVITSWAIVRTAVRARAAATPAPLHAAHS